MKITEAHIKPKNAHSNGAALANRNRTPWRQHNDAQTHTDTKAEQKTQVMLLPKCLRLSQLHDRGWPKARQCTYQFRTIPVTNAIVPPDIPGTSPIHAPRNMTSKVLLGCMALSKSLTGDCFMTTQRLLVPETSGTNLTRSCTRSRNPSLVLS